MQYHIEEPGLLYDSLAFLSLFIEDTKPAKQDGNTYFQEIKESLCHNGIIVPEHLSPLVCRQGKPYSFLSSVLFDEWKYSQCSFARAEQAIKLLANMKRRFVEFYFPAAGSDTIRKMTQMNYPNAIGLLKQAIIPPEIKTDLLYILFSFDDAMREIARIITRVREEMEKLHRRFAEQNNEALKRVQMTPVADQLKAISGLAQDRTTVRYSLSLMDEEKISFRHDEPDFFILGSRFSDVLETKYKYCHVTPASFIRDLGNEAKRVIFEALLNMLPMSAADMEVKLHLSRNAVARNIKELRECGVVTAERKGLSYYYTLNKAYIGIIAEQLERLKYQRVGTETAEGR